MTKKIILLTLTAISVIAFSFISKTDSDLKHKLEHLSGTFADVKPYKYGEAWGKRIFEFKDGKWSLLFTLALDPELKAQVFQFRTHGSYIVQERSGKVKEAYNAIFKEDRKLLTLKTNDRNLITAFGFSPCNLTQDIEVDISAKGCSAWKSVAECPADHDLLYLDKEGRLYFGTRPADNDMCSPEKRPVSLTPPVVKIK